MRNSLLFIALFCSLTAIGAENTTEDSVADRLAVVEEKLQAIEFLTSTLEAIESFTDLISSVDFDANTDTPRANDADYNFFDVTISGREIESNFGFSRALWDTVIHATRIPKPIRAAKGEMVFADLFDDPQMRIPFTLTDTLQTGESLVLDRMSTTDIRSGFSWFSQTDLDDMKVWFEVDEILYLDEAPETVGLRAGGGSQRSVINSSSSPDSTRQLSLENAITLLQQGIQHSWVRPPSARNGMRAVLQIRMLPTGEILSIAITESSGDEPFDRSAENAVLEAAPFSEFQFLPRDVFEANFRSVSFVFEPDDL